MISITNMSVNLPKSPYINYDICTIVHRVNEIGLYELAWKDLQLHLVKEQE
jgi:hypothetical protein